MRTSFNAASRKAFHNKQTYHFFRNRFYVSSQLSFDLEQDATDITKHRRYWTGKLITYHGNKKSNQFTSRNKNYSRVGEVA